MVTVQTVALSRSKYQFPVNLRGGTRRSLGFYYLIANNRSLTKIFRSISDSLGGETTP